MSNVTVKYILKYKAYLPFSISVTLSLLCHFVQTDHTGFHQILAKLGVWGVLFFFKEK